jgi:hypothetical protein
MHLQPCPNCPDVYTSHVSGICSACRDGLASSINNAIRAIWAERGTIAEYGFPKSSGIPSTARAILDMVPERKTPPATPKQQEQAAGVARAVANLSNHEKRLGASRFQP